MNKPLEFMARRENWNLGISLYARQMYSDKDFYTAQPVVFEEAEEGNIIEPFATLSIQSAQQLMDELWNCGLRPTEGTGSAGSLKATEAHLEDMRTLVFSLLNKVRK